MEIPKYIRHDFLLTILGIIIMFYVGYKFLESGKVALNILETFFFIVGFSLFTTGIMDVQRDYIMDHNLKRLEYEIKKYDSLIELKKRVIIFYEKNLLKIKTEKNLEVSSNNRQVIHKSLQK